MSAIMSAMCSVARGYSAAGRRFRSAASAWNAASYASAISREDRPSRARRRDRVDVTTRALGAHVPDVGDVLDLADPSPWYSSGSADEVGEQERAQVADVRRAVHGRTARVHPAPPARLERLHRGSTVRVSVSRSRRVMVRSGADL